LIFAARQMLISRFRMRAFAFGHAAGGPFVGGGVRIDVRTRGVAMQQAARDMLL